jgi:hypothetical protein
MSTTRGNSASSKLQNLGRSASLQRRTSKRHECAVTSKFCPTVQFLWMHATKERNFNGSWVTLYSSFEKLVTSTPRIIRDLHTMSQAKAAPDVLQDRECKKRVYTNSSNFICTRNKGTEPRVPVWHSGMREAFLTHFISAQETIKKKGSFKSTRNLPNLMLVTLRLRSYDIPELLPTSAIRSSSYKAS